MNKSTFTRIVKPGRNLTMKVQIIKLKDHELSGKQIQEVCSALGNHHNIAATPYRLNGIQAIAVNADVTVPCSWKKVEKNKQEKLTVSFERSERHITLAFANITHRQILADLYFRNLLIRVNNSKLFGRISSDSHRIFYDKSPFSKDGDIGAFQRYELSDVVIDGTGIGINVEIGTAFFSLKTVAQYYEEGKEERLHELMDRRALNVNNDKVNGREKRGTLTFFAPERTQTCYFDRFLVGENCSSSDPKTINGEYYDNLVDYYKNDKGYINPDDAVAVVSFKNLSGVRVPANKLRVRVFTDKLPRKLANIDKINPENRRYGVNQFWDLIGNNPNGSHYQDFYGYRFYNPPKERSGIMEMPGLKFGKGNRGEHAILYPPSKKDKKSYKDYFYNRKKYLDKYGCYHVPPTIEREIYFPFPVEANIPEDAKEQVAIDICKKIGKLTRTEINYIISDYKHHIEATYQMKRDAEDETGMTVFTFDGRNPATYHQISSELSDWGLKRLTANVLKKKFYKLQQGDQRGWDSYIDFIAYDVIQKMGCIPWVLTTKMNYDIHLAIDVSEKFKYYALSLMVHNEGMRRPTFITHIHRKTDSYNETINPEFLEEGIRKIFREAGYDTVKSKNLLIYRDGKDCKEELQTVKKILPSLIEDGILSNDLEWDYIEYRKSMMKSLRVYDSYGKNDKDASNSLEGSFFDVHPSEWSLIATTGAATLHQGTANPLSVRNDFTYGDLSNIREDLFLAAQYNFSNPSKAQRHSLPLMRADEELQSRMAQEIKGLRIK